MIQPEMRKSWVEIVLKDFKAVLEDEVSAGNWQYKAINQGNY
jgi:hypothetical protein